MLAKLILCPWKNALYSTVKLCPPHHVSWRLETYMYTTLCLRPQTLRKGTNALPSSLLYRQLAPQHLAPTRYTWLQRKSTCISSARGILCVCVFLVYIYTCMQVHAAHAWMDNQSSERMYSCRCTCSPSFIIHHRNSVVYVQCVYL